MIIKDQRFCFTSYFVMIKLMVLTWGIQLIITVTFLANIILGLLVFLRNRQSKTNIYFFLLSLVLALWSISNYFSLNTDSQEMTLFWVRAVMAITAFFGPFLYLFVTNFPQEIKDGKKGQWLVLAFGLLTSIAAWSPYMFVGVSVYEGKVSPVPGSGIVLFALNLLILLALSLNVFVKKFKRSYGAAKQQLKFFILGILSSFVLGTITNFLLVIIYNFSDFVIFGPSFSLFFVGLTTYAIIKHRLMDIRLVVARTASYSLLLLILSGFYSMSLFSLGRVFYGEEINGGQIIINGLLALVIAFTFQPLRRLLERVTDKIFFKDKYEPTEALQKISRALNSSLSLEEIVLGCLNKLEDYLKVENATVIIFANGSIKPIFLHQCDDFQLTVESAHELADAKTQPLIFDELNEGRYKNILRKSDCAFVISLKTKEKKIGLLLLQHKRSGDIYNTDDINLLSVLWPELSVAIQNALAYQKIQEFSETLKKEVQKATESLRNSNNRLKEVSELKDEFVSLASHELRTPMTAVSGTIATILDGFTGKVNKETKEFLLESKNEIDRLLRMVNNLLNISRIESGRIKYDLEKFDAWPIIKTVFANLQPLAEEKGLKLVLPSPKSETKLTLYADKDKLEEVLTNLIGNSIKYTEKGSVSLAVAKKNRTVVFSVTDTGIGITPEDQKKLFRRFSRIKEGRTTAKGTGLGLYICKIMVGGMKGKIWVESAVGKGSRFVFILPSNQ